MPFDSLLRHVSAGRPLRTALLATMLLAACQDTASPPVTVPVARVAITTPRDELLVGETHDFDAVAISPVGDALPDRAVEWRSEDQTIATISTSGVLTALRSGIASIVASSGGRETRIQVRIIAPNALPTLNGTAPDLAVAGRTTSLAVQLQGTGFTTQSVGLWDGNARPTEFVSATELRMTITPDDLATAGAYAISVRTPTPGGGTSTAMVFTVASPAPAIVDIAPRRVVMGWGMPLAVTVTGTGFTGETRLLVDDQVRTVDQRTATTLTFRLLPADLTTARAIEIGVVNGAPGGGAASTTFTVESVPVASIQLTFENDARWTWESLRLPVNAITRSATNREIFDQVVQWNITPASVAQVIPVDTREGAVFGEGPGLATLRASVGDVSSANATIRVYARPAYDVLYSGGTAADRYIARWPLGSGNAPFRINLGMMAMHPAPAPDGRYFAFTGYSAAFPTSELYIARIDGKEIRQLTADNAVDQHPAWSPDGARLAFESTRTGFLNIFTMRTDGTDVQQLTFARLNDPLVGSGQSAARPAWSPNGQQIAYTVGLNGRSQLWVMNADGSNKRRLTDVEAGGDYEPTWSADGRHILVRRETPGAGGVTQVRVDVATGNAVSNNTAPILFGWTPSYSPDGQWLIMSEAHSMLSPRLYAVPVRPELIVPRVVLPAFWVGGIRDARWIVRAPTPVP